MPANKNALIRYKTIDNCLRNKYRRWTINDLVDACSDALYDIEGITKGVSLRTMYQSFNAKEPTEYILYPYLLKEYRNRWFLFGSVKKDLVLYNLALDRIVSVEPLDIPFKENPEFDCEHFFDDVIGVSKNIHNTPRTIKFWASQEQSKYILTKPLHHSQKLIKQNEDGSCIFKISVVINFELYSVLMSYGPGVRVIYPRQAVSYMRDKTKEMAALYEQHIHFDKD